VSSDPPGATVVDVRTPIQGQEIRNAYGEVLAPTTLGLRRGHHAITAKLGGYLDQTWEFDTADTPPPPHVFAMVKPAVAGVATVRERPIPTSAWVTGGIAVALGVGSAVTGALGIAEHSQYQSDNNGLNVKAARSDRSTGMTLNSVADGLLIGTVVSAGLAIYFVVSRPTVERPMNGALPPSPRPSLWPTQVSPTWDARGRGGGGLEAGWVF